MKPLAARLAAADALASRRDRRRQNRPVRYSFGDTVLDTTRYQLRRGDEFVHVEPQVFDVLAHLVEHRDRVVTKSELLETVWGHGFVSESALTTRIKQLRQAVGDTGRDQRVVQTVHGRGYRFIAPVEEEPDDGERPLLAVPPGLRQDIHFCTATDGTRIAYATVGTGPPLVRAAHWITHLDYDWQSPVWRHWLVGLARQRQFIRYDERGCGLSDARRRRLLHRRLRAGPRGSGRRPRPGTVPAARRVPGRRRSPSPTRRAIPSGSAT